MDMKRVTKKMPCERNANNIGPPDCAIRTAIFSPNVVLPW